MAVEVGSVIAKIQADLRSFERAFAKAGRTFASFKRDVERQAIKVSLDDRGMSDLKRQLGSFRQSTPATSSRTSSATSVMRSPR
jgi:hypothetical protein